MSIALPVLPRSDSFIAELLREQNALTAVERFSEVHSSSEHIQARYYRDLLPSAPPRPGYQFAFEVDLDKCSGCKACVVACHSMNGLEDDEVWRRVGTTMTRGPIGRIQHVTTACHHCEEPACLLGCPVRAYIKDPVTGIVQHLDDQCIGCQYCTMMCPYEVPQYSARLGIVRKCDMCHQRLSAGEAPACVQGCPNEAIAIREVAVEQGGNCSDQRLCPDAPSSAITKPTTVYKTAHAKEFAASFAQDLGTLQVADSHWPLAVMLVATQASVGLILSERMLAAWRLAVGSEPYEPVTRLSTLVALGLAILGLNIAPLHLGQPRRAWRVFLGLRTSWLSREAVILGAYVGLLAAATAQTWHPIWESALPARINEWAGRLPEWTGNALLGMSLLFGITGLISSAMVYVVTRRGLWRMGRTMPRFLFSGMTTGAGCMLPILAFESTSFLHYSWMSAATFVLLAVKLVWEVRLCLLSGQSDLDRRSARLLKGPMKAVLLARLALGVAALLLIVASVSTWSSQWEAGTGLTALGAALLLLTGELAERLLYFTTVVYDRMPGTLR